MSAGRVRWTGRGVINRNAIKPGPIQVLRYFEDEELAGFGRADAVGVAELAAAVKSVGDQR